MSYVNSIEVINNGKDLGIPNINYRVTFIEECINLSQNGRINKIEKVLEDGKEKK